MIPPWLTDTDTLTATPPSAGKQTFLEKTIRDTAAFAEKTIFSDTIARQDGLLQRFHPDCKLPAFLLLIITVSLLKSAGTIWGVYLFTLIPAALSAIRLRFFIKRVWLFIPLFAVLIALPAMFNLIVPGEPLWVVAHLEKARQFGPWQIPADIAITRQGVQAAVIFIGRVAASVSLAVLLTLTTVWNELLQALRVLRVPQIFILILAMTYRYILLLVRTVAELHIARRSRTVRYLPTGLEQGWVASRMGYLFRKSYHLSQEVHNAMLARGFSGEVKGLALRRAFGRDYLLIVAALLLCIVLLVVDRHI